MSDVEALVRAYERFVALPWDRSVSFPQRVWMAVYPPRDERRIRARVVEFETATVKAGHAWRLFDLTDTFGQWMGAHEYRDSYFEQPELLSNAVLDDFGTSLQQQVRAALHADGVDDQTVVALLGAGSLFGLYRVSRLLEAVNEAVQGRLLVFFPGERDGSNYRLLEAQDGWNYLATPITATEEFE